MTVAQSMTVAQKSPGGSTLRVLFCITVTDEFFKADADARGRVFESCVNGFDDLAGRFGLTVLGTIDDDQLMVGSTGGRSRTAYILADAPDLTQVVEVCNLIRSTKVGEDMLWKYLGIEARLGRPLFFGNE